MPAGEQHVQQHAERVDVGRRRDPSAGQLLGRRVLRRQRPAAFARQSARLRRYRRPGAARVGLEQLRDAEIEQLDVAVDADEHVGGLEIAVHDQVGMRVRDGREHFEKQAKAGVDIQPVLVAVAVDPLAFDVLEDEIRLPRRRNARVDRGGRCADAEAGEDVAFAPEPLLARRGP